MERAHTWTVADAKEKLGEVVERAADEGPQVLTNEGRPAAVVLSIAEYQALRRPRRSFEEFLLNGPLEDVPLERVRSAPRKVDL